MKKMVFYISKFCHIKDSEEIDLGEIPSLIRRKLSPVDKLGLSIINKIYDEKAEEIVFSSKLGEITRLETIINQYKELNEVSPAQFSGSVHNYLLGFFTLFKKLNTPYSAISSGENSISAGLVKSIISTKNEVLFCYADDVALGCLISKNDGEIKCEFSPSKKASNENEFERFIEFMENKTDEFDSAFGKIKRVEG